MARMTALCPPFDPQRGPGAHGATAHNPAVIVSVTVHGAHAKPAERAPVPAPAPAPAPAPEGRNYVAMQAALIQPTAMATAALNSAMAVLPRAKSSRHLGPISSMTT